MSAESVFHETAVLMCFVLVAMNILACSLKDLRNMAEESTAQQAEQTELLKKQNQMLKRQIELLSGHNKETEEQSEDSDSTDEDE